MNKISLGAAPAIRDFRIHLEWLPRSLATLFGQSAGVRPDERALTHRLAKRQAKSFANPRGLQFTCTVGSLWLTIAGEPQDIILEAGESFRCAAPGHLVATAFESSSRDVTRFA
jgi:hypothetical protein